MSMNASPRMLTDLLTQAGAHFVIPVYQRPYSWDKEQCEQLWDDVLRVGRKADASHFTGSVVWVQGSVMQAGGSTPMLLIDGQQRMTTAMLLIAALADYARGHAGKTNLSFSRERIVDTGFLLDKYQDGPARYKLTLSEGDRDVFRAIMDNIEDSDAPLPKADGHLMENFAFFKERIEKCEDSNIVWEGVRRLEVVSISLDAGKDNPQLIFESMNSTGKDLSSADLIRNFMLMGLNPDYQEKVYKNHWRVIEDTIGRDETDKKFDQFIYCYLVVVLAPSKVSKKKVYSLFKRYVLENELNEGDRLIDLLQKMEAYARYYSCITSGKDADETLACAFRDVAALEAGVFVPLLMALYADYEADRFSADQFERMVRLVESYILRRSVVDLQSNTHKSLVYGFIAFVRDIPVDGEAYVEQFERRFADEASKKSRFPSDKEFENALLTRDLYNNRMCRNLLEGLEYSCHPKDTWRLDSKAYTIEHVMPRNALAHDEWLAVLDKDSQDAFESICDNLGNLTLTAYNSELSDGSFAEKKYRVVGGYDKECLVISQDVRNAASWGPAQIAARAKTLAARAVRRWPSPSFANGSASIAKGSQEGMAPRKNVTLKQLCDAKYLSPGEKLFMKYQGVEKCFLLTERYTLMLANGEEFASASSAATRAVELAGGSGQRNGLEAIKLRDGRKLSDLRDEYLASRQSS